MNLVGLNEGLLFFTFHLLNGKVDNQCINKLLKRITENVIASAHLGAVDYFSFLYQLTCLSQINGLLDLERDKLITALSPLKPQQLSFQNVSNILSVLAWINASN